MAICRPATSAASQFVEEINPYLQILTVRVLIVCPPLHWALPSPMSCFGRLCIACRSEPTRRPDHSNVLSYRAKHYPTATCAPDYSLARLLLLGTGAPTLGHST